jgi:hypothetical protein
MLVRKMAETTAVQMVDLMALTAVAKSVELSAGLTAF